MNMESFPARKGMEDSSIRPFIITLNETKQSGNFTQEQTEHTRHSIQKIGRSYLKKTFPEKQKEQLTTKHILPLIQLANGRLFGIARKIAQAAYAGPLKYLEEQKQRYYLHSLWKKLKDNFSQFYLQKNRYKN